MSPDVVDTKKRLLKSLISNNVFEVVPFINQVTVSCCWIILKKYKDGEKKIKVRLVACGFEEDTNNLRKYSLT